MQNEINQVKLLLQQQILEKKENKKKKEKKKLEKKEKKVIELVPKILKVAPTSTPSPVVQTKPLVDHIKRKILNF